MDHIKGELKGKGSQGVIYRKGEGSAARAVHVWNISWYLPQVIATLGGIGDWRNVFSRDLSDEFDKMWTKEMQRLGLCGLGRSELQFYEGDGAVLKC